MGMELPEQESKVYKGSIPACALYGKVKRAKHGAAPFTVFSALFFVPLSESRKINFVEKPLVDRERIKCQKQSIM